MPQNPPLMDYEWAENRLAEFTLWASGIGVFAGERASLDSRLATEWETKNLVLSILTLLLACIEKCQTAGTAIRFLCNCVLIIT